jgi:hypothetical protein
MSSQPGLQDILSEMAHLLESHEQDSWATALHRLAREAQTDPSGVLADVRRMYGGMGSISDIVLYSKDGLVPTRENERLHQLRAELFQLTRH